MILYPIFVKPLNYTHPRFLAWLRSPGLSLRGVFLLSSALSTPIFRSSADSLCLGILHPL